MNLQGVEAVSLLYGFANNSRTFPWTASREHIHDAFLVYVNDRFPHLSEFDRHMKLQRRWNAIFEHVHNTTDGGIK